MTNEKEVLDAEKALRNIPIRMNLNYKPNIFSTLGIYRNDKFKLRPTIYTSEKDYETDDGRGGYKVTNVMDSNWSFIQFGPSADNAALITFEDIQERLVDLKQALRHLEDVCVSYKKGLKKDKEVEEFKKKSLSKM